MSLARRYLELCGMCRLDCRLSERKPAELYAAEPCEAGCGAGCAVVTGDCDAAGAIKDCAVLLFRGGRFWCAHSSTT